MLALIIRRLVQSILVMIAVALIAFTLFRYVGDPISQMVGQETSIEDRERLREELGLNDSVVVQFARFVGNSLRGEFGISFRIGHQTKRPLRAAASSPRSGSHAPSCARA